MESRGLELHKLDVDALRAIVLERDAEVKELQKLARDAHADRDAKVAAYDQQTYDLRAENAALRNGGGKLVELLEKPPKVTAEFLAALREQHELEPLRRHIDLSHRGLKLVRQEAEIADWRDRHGKLTEEAKRLAREKHDATVALEELRNNHPALAEVKRLNRELADRNHPGLARVAAELERVCAAHDAVAQERDQLRARVVELTKDLAAALDRTVPMAPP